MRRHSACSAIVAGSVALTVGVTSAHAQQKSISLLIAGSVGSLYNAYGRMRHGVDHRHQIVHLSRTTSGGIYREIRTSS